MDKKQNTLEIDLIKSLDQLPDIRKEWSDVFCSADTRYPFISYEWMYCWIKNFGAQYEPFVILVRLDNMPIGIAPFILSRTSKFRHLEFIASDRSDYLDFIVKKGFREIVMKRLFGYLSSIRKQWDFILLRNVFWEDQQRSLFHTTVIESGLDVLERDYTISPFLRIQGSWEDFLKSRGGKYRKRMKKKEKRLFGQEGIAVQRIYGTYSNTSGIDGLFETAKDIERRSWKFLEGNPRLQTDRKAEGFFKDVLKEFLLKGWLDAWFVYFHNRPVAYAFNFSLDGKKYAYNSAFDEEFRKKGPGALLHLLRINSAFSEGVKEYDFLRGAEPYKLEWTDTHRVIREYCILNSTLRSDLLARQYVRARWALAKSKTIKNLRYKLITFKNKRRLSRPNAQNAQEKVDPRL